MQKFQPSVFARDDTFFGVCEALGEDLRIPSNVIRLAFGATFLFNPPLVAGTYVAAGIVVAISRLICPNPRLPAPPEEWPAARQADNDADRELLAVAA